MSKIEPDLSDCLIILDGFYGTMKEMTQMECFNNLYLKSILKIQLRFLERGLIQLAPTRTDLREYKGNIINVKVSIKKEVNKNVSK